jgi:hypothetical protein
LSLECGDNLILSDGEDWVPWNQGERKVQVETIQLASEAKEDEYKDQSSMMKVGIKFVEENAMKAYKKVQGGEPAPPVVNGDAIDGEMALEACVAEYAKGETIQCRIQGYDSEEYLDCR